MDSVFKQNLQSGISRLWVQRAQGKLTDEQFSYFVRGANYALRFLKLKYSITETELIEIDSMATTEDISELSTKTDPVNSAYFKRGFLQIDDCIKREGEVIPELSLELDRVQKLI